MIHSQRLLRYAISRKEEAASSNLWLSTNCRNKSLRLYLTILSHCYVTCSKAAIDKTTLWSNSSDWLSTLFKCECSQLRIIQNVFVNAQHNDNFQAKPYLSHICFFFSQVVIRTYFSVSLPSRVSRVAPKAPMSAPANNAC